MNPTAGFAVAFAAALVLTPVAGRIATHFGILDRPGPLKVQQRPVPYLGGLAVLAAVAIPVASRRPALLVPMALATALGVVDDVRHVPVRWRLALEAVIGVVAGLLVDTRLPTGLSVVLIALTLVVLVNAVNLLDGLDGLATGVACVSAIGFAILLRGDPRFLALVMAGALAGFLVHNRPPARIYLGDAGSYLIGTTLALLLADAWSATRRPALAPAAVLLVVVPVADTAIAIVRRTRAGHPLFEGDRGHVYDQLVDRGWPATAAVVGCVVAQGVLAIVAVFASKASLALATTLTIACVVAIVAGAIAGGFLDYREPRSLQ